MALGRKRKKDDLTEAAKQSRAEAEFSEAAEAPQAPAPAEPGEAVEKVHPADMPLYRVLKTKIVSIRGAMTTLVEGKVLDPRYYGGLVGIDRLRDAGVELEVAS